MLTHADACVGDNFDELSAAQLAPLFSAAAAQVERYEDTVVLPHFLCSEERKNIYIYEERNNIYIYEERNNIYRYEDTGTRTQLCSQTSSAARRRWLKRKRQTRHAGPPCPPTSLPSRSHKKK
jgi:hypothetical protein